MSAAPARARPLQLAGTRRARCTRLQLQPCRCSSYQGALLLQTTLTGPLAPASPHTTAPPPPRCTVNHAIIGLRSRIMDGVTIQDAMVMGCDYYESDAQVCVCVCVCVWGGGGGVLGALAAHLQPAVAGRLGARFQAAATSPVGARPG